MSPAIDKVVALTDDIQAAVDGGEWARAHALDVERRALLERLLVSSAELAGSAELSAVLTELERRSRHLVGEVQHHRRRVLREASMIRTGHAAVGAYATEPVIAENP